MFAAMLIPAASADGVILFSDDFESDELDGTKWIIPGTAFEPAQGGPTNSGYLQDWAGSHVLQSAYGETATVLRTYGADVAFKCDAWMLDDGGKGWTNHRVSLWWADYFTESGDEGRIVYEVRVLYEDRAVQLTAYGEGGGTSYFAEETVLAEWKLPDSEPLEMDEYKPTVFNIGMRINGAQIDGFYNDQKVVSFTAPRASEWKSPLLFVNTGCWCGIDNFVAATAGYNLFNESADAQQASGNGGTSNNGQGAADQGSAGGNSGGNSGNASGNGGTKTRIETTIDSEIVTHSRVIGVDENGNEITTIESEIVTVIGSREVADTDGSGSSANRGGSATGDAAVIVISVMVVALGSAIVVWKKTSRAK